MVFVLFFSKLCAWRSASISCDRHFHPPFSSLDLVFMIFFFLNTLLSVQNYQRNVLLATEQLPFFQAFIHESIRAGHALDPNKFPYVAAMVRPCALTYPA